MEANQLPTKPGPYYWRESDRHKWDRVFEVQLSHSMGLCVSAGFYYESVQQRGGQWLPIPTAEELVKLQAKAKSYDKGREQWQIWDPCHSKLEMVGRTQDEAIIAFRKSITYSNPPEPWCQYLAAGYTCRKVRVCKEVDE